MQYVKEQIASKIIFGCQVLLKQFFRPKHPYILFNLFFHFGKINTNLFLHEMFNLRYINLIVNLGRVQLHVTMG